MEEEKGLPKLIILGMTSMPFVLGGLMCIASNVCSGIDATYGVAIEARQYSNPDEREKRLNIYVDNKLFDMEFSNTFEKYFVNPGKRFVYGRVKGVEIPIK